MSVAFTHSLSVVYLWQDFNMLCYLISSCSSVAAAKVKLIWNKLMELIVYFDSINIINISINRIIF